MATARPYAEWTTRTVALDSLIRKAKGETPTNDRQALRTHQTAVGWSIEDLELILHPMIEDGKEAVGSMGDDTPLACCRSIIAACIISSGRISARSPTRPSIHCANAA